MLKYKNLLNSFVDYGRAYGQTTKNTINDMYLRFSMGLVEEYMYERKFTDGTMGGVASKMVGTPNKIFDEVLNQYNSLKTKIKTETSEIQKELLKLNVSTQEREYIKNTLLSTLESQLEHISSCVLTTTNTIRTAQNKVVDVVDKLNFVTTNNIDGKFMSKTGGMVKVFMLSASTELTQLKLDYTGSTKHLDGYIRNNISNVFTKSYPGGGEYLFFLNRLCTNDVKSFNFNGSYHTQIKEVLRYRDGKLYDKVTKVDDKMVNGIRPQIVNEFKKLLTLLITPWVEYDLSNYNDRIKDNLISGHETLVDNLTRFNSLYNIDYGTNNTSTEENLVITELKERNSGVRDNNFNHKRVNDLYIG
tara:strand:- start:279 stop:1358 length:1080 start_codon:yes stop_codon:yes gene_type:complete